MQQPSGEPTHPLSASSWGLKPVLSRYGTYALLIWCPICRADARPDARSFEHRPDERASARARGDGSAPGERASDANPNARSYVLDFMPYSEEMRTTCLA